MRGAIALSLALVATSACGPCGPVDGEGFAERLVVEVQRLHSVDGTLVDDELDLDGALPIAAGTLGGGPVVIAGELVDGALTGALLVFRDVLAGGPPLRFERVLERGPHEEGAEATFADLDGDGDGDVLLRFTETNALVALIDGGDGVSLAAARALDGRGQGAQVDVDTDGVLDLVLGGFNGDMHIVRIADDALVVDRRSALHRVDDLGYCPTSFAEIGGALYATAAVCAVFGSTDAQPVGPDRLFALDDALAPVASVDTGLEETSRIFPLADDSIGVSGYTFAVSLDRVGDARAVVVAPPLPAPVDILAELSVFGTVDLEGDGEPALLVAAGFSEPPAGTVGLPGQPNLIVGPFVVDLDGDGADDVLHGTITFTQ